MCYQSCCDIQFSSNRRGCTQLKRLCFDEVFIRFFARFMVISTGLIGHSWSSGWNKTMIKRKREAWGREEIVYGNKNDCRLPRRSARCCNQVGGIHKMHLWLDFGFFFIWYHFSLLFVYHLRKYSKEEVYTVRSPFTSLRCWIMCCSAALSCIISIFLASF